MSDTTPGRFQAAAKQLSLDLFFDTRVPVQQAIGALAAGPYDEVLAPYSGPDSECPKCTAERPAIRYHQAQDGLYHIRLHNEVSESCQLPYRGAPIPEHLHRTCTTCQYAWVEKVADRIAEAHEH